MMQATPSRGRVLLLSSALARSAGHHFPYDLSARTLGRVAKPVGIAYAVWWQVFDVHVTAGMFFWLTITL